jgi:hypothetical protein
MKADNKRARKKGSLPNDQQFVQMINSFRQEPAWLALSFGARCLYVEIKAIYNGQNNGRIMCSIRHGAEMISSTRRSAERFLRELQDHGFIVETAPGFLGVNGKGKGRLWRLTELGFMGERPTKNYRDWQPQKNRTPSPLGGQSVLRRGTGKALGVLLGGTGCPTRGDSKGGKTAPDCPTRGDNLIYQGEGDDAAVVSPSAGNEPAKPARPSPKSNESKKVGEFVGEPRRFTTTIKPKRAAPAQT